MTTIFNKRNFPLMSRVLYDFRQIFGDDVEYTYAKEGANEYGEEWRGQGVVPVLEFDIGAGGGLPKKKKK